MVIETVPIDSITLDPANARKHPQRNTDAIAGSLKRFGQQKPIVVDSNGLVRAGNGTLQAAKALGWTEIKIVRSDLPLSEMTAFAIADNRTAELAEWDEEVLLAALQSPEVGDVGFDESEIAALDRMVNPSVAEEDEIPTDVARRAERGQLWKLGEHRLRCGDSTNAEDVQTLLGGCVPFIMVTDPHYGVEYDPEWRKEAGINNSDRMGKVSNDDRVDWTPAYKLFPGHVAYVWHAGRFAADLVVNLRDAKFEIRTQIIWRKPRIVISRCHYHWQHEPAWYAVRSGGSAKWCGDRTQSTIWDIDAKNQDSDTTHGTQKPVECMARPIRNHGGKDDDVYDPFLGSGTTLIACEQLGRRCFGMELVPKYCDVIIERWERFTGKKAECLSAVGTGA